METDVGVEDELQPQTMERPNGAGSEKGELLSAAELSGWWCVCIAPICWAVVKYTDEGGFLRQKGWCMIGPIPAPCVVKSGESYCVNAKYARMESNRVGGIAGTAFQTVHEEHNDAEEQTGAREVIEGADEVLVYISKSCYRGIGVYQRNPYDREGEERQRVDGAVQYCSPPICGMRCC